MTVNSSTSIRVMIVDDHELVRYGVGLALETFDDLLLVAEAANGHEALHQCQQHRPDVILIDLMMPDIDGITATLNLSQQYPGPKIIMLSSFPDAKMVEAAMQAGAIGYLLKNVSIDDLAQTIREAYWNGQNEAASENSGPDSILGKEFKW